MMEAKTMLDDSCVFAEAAFEAIEAPARSVACTCERCRKQRMLWAYFTPGDEDFQLLARSGAYRWAQPAAHPNGL
jgi:hypothetical protein